MSVRIITDSACDLPLALAEKNDIDVLSMPFVLKGEEHLDDLGKTTDIDEFYDTLRAGENATTSQVPFGSSYEAFERAYAAGSAAVFISLSAELSGTYQTAVLARDQFLEAHPDASIYVVDSKCASTGEGLLVLAAAERAAEGMRADEIAQWVEDNRGRVNHLFTIDSFEHLVRGGRVSAAMGAAGTILNIKPVMRVDDRGRLVPLKKPRGRHKALEAIADLTAERIEDPASQTIVIAHGQWPEYAEELKRMILERITVGGVIDARIGCVIGAHTGPGVLSVYFWGVRREPYND
ncbi:MAG: DegV family protein [Coriobacteriia bacterium]|nr:DegV family protein [Coriobacteriia bacterium]